MFILTQQKECDDISKQIMRKDGLTNLILTERIEDREEQAW